MISTMHAIQRTGLALLALLVSTLACLAQTTVTDHRTPGGIAFRHALVSADTHHAIAFGWRDGQASAFPGKEGLVALAPELLLEGSGNLSRNADHEQLTDLQASIRLRSTTRNTIGTISAPPQNLGAAVKLFAAKLADPALPADKLKLRQGNLLAGLAQAGEQAETLALRVFLRVTLGEGPALRVLAYEPDSIASVTVADVESWRRAVLARDTVVVASAGPMPAADVAIEIDRLLERLPAKAELAQPAISAPRQPGRLIVIEKPVAQTAIVAGGPSGWRNDPDVVRGSIAVRTLSGGFGSRLYGALRETLGAVYGVKAELQAIDDERHLFVIRAAVANDKAAAALAAIRAEYARFLSKGVTETEVAPLKTKLIAEVREAWRRALGTARAMRNFALAGHPPDHMATYATKVAELTTEAVNEGIRTKFPKAPLTVIMVAPSAAGLAADCVIKSAAEIGRCE